MRSGKTLLRIAWIAALYPILPVSIKRHFLIKQIVKLGPSFIKFGQMLSNRPDIVGDTLASDLSHLQDRLPPFSKKKAKRIIEKELGDSINTVFADFDPKPIAAASISQVHKAVTADGKQVAVKILRPGIAKAFARDIALFYNVAKWLEKKYSISRLRLHEVVQTFEQWVKIELDLKMEAAAAAELKENCCNDSHFYVPSIDWNRTSHKVLTLEWIDGIAVHKKQALQNAGLDLHTIATLITQSFLNQAYRDGFFHADMHSGNILITLDGKIACVDFGIMGRIDRETRKFVVEILQGFIEKDYRRVAQIHLDAGYVPRHTSLEQFAQALRSIGEPIVGKPLKETPAGLLLEQLFKVTEHFGMETQPQLLLLQKTMVQVEGVCYGLDPDINMWEIATPWIEQWVKEFFSFESNLKEQALTLSSTIRRLPATLQQLADFVDETTHQGIKLHPDTIASLTPTSSKTYSSLQLTGVVFMVTAIMWWLLG